MAKRKKTGGRKKGTPNKATASIRGAVVEAFDLLGGVPALVRWGRRNRTEFYRLAGRLIPREHEHSGPDGQPIPHEHRASATATAEDVALARAILGSAAGPVHPDGGPQSVAGPP